MKKNNVKATEKKLEEKKTKPKPKRKMGPKDHPVDWERIEVDFKAGLLSICEIARQHGISDVAIHKHAKKRGWKRNLSRQVRNQVRNEIHLANTASNSTDEEIVNQTATRIARKIESHIARANRLQDVFDKIIETVDREGEGEAPISVRERAQTLRDCAMVLDKAISLERLSLNIDEVARTSNSEYIVLD